MKLVATCNWASLLSLLGGPGRSSPPLGGQQSTLGLEDEQDNDNWIMGQGKPSSQPKSRSSLVGWDGIPRSHVSTGSELDLLARLMDLNPGFQDNT